MLPGNLTNLGSVHTPAGQLQWYRWLIEIFDSHEAPDDQPLETMEFKGTYSQAVDQQEAMRGRLASKTNLLAMGVS